MARQYPVRGFAPVFVAATEKRQDGTRGVFVDETGDASSLLRGVAATGQVGSLQVTLPLNHRPDGPAQSVHRGTQYPVFYNETGTQQNITRVGTFLDATTTIFGATTTGVSATGAVGSLTVQNAAAPVGVSSLGVAQDLSGKVSIPLSATSSASAIGTELAMIGVPLPAVSSASAVGTFTDFDITLLLIGASASASAGTPSGSLATTLDGATSSATGSAVTPMPGVLLPDVSSPTEIGTFTFDLTFPLTGAATSASVSEVALHIVNLIGLPPYHVGADRRLYHVAAESRAVHVRPDHRQFVPK